MSRDGVWQAGSKVLAVAGLVVTAGLAWLLLGPAAPIPAPDPSDGDDASNFDGGPLDGGGAGGVGGGDPADSDGTDPDPTGNEGDPVRVTLEGGTLLVDGEPHPVVKCVGYQPAPVGVSPGFGYRWARFPENYEGDLPLLEGLGANVVAVNTRSASEPDELRTFMTRALERGIHTVIVVNGPNGQDASDPEVQRWFMESVEEAVDAYADHPGLLMWWLGNEVDYLYPEPSRVGDWYALLERATALVHERDPNHPALTANNPRTDTRELLRGSPSVDAFGLNMYVSSHERALRDIFNVSGETGGMPLFVTEFGSDAFNNSTGEEDEATQARVVTDVWAAMMAAREEGAPILGGCVHEWSDQWWKSGELDEQDPGPAWPSPEKGVLPDDAFSEEWFGIVRLVPGSTERDPREAYYRLAEAWGGASAPKG